MASVTGSGTTVIVTESPGSWSPVKFEPPVGSAYRISHWFSPAVKISPSVSSLDW